MLSEHPIPLRAIGNNQGRPAPREARSKGVPDRLDRQEAPSAALYVRANHSIRSLAIDSRNTLATSIPHSKNNRDNNEKNVLQVFK